MTTATFTTPMAPNSPLEDVRAGGNRRPPPHPDSLGRTLTRGCELGLLVRTGEGNKAEAFRYGLAQREPAT